MSNLRRALRFLQHELSVPAADAVLSGVKPDDMSESEWQGINDDFRAILGEPSRDTEIERIGEALRETGIAEHHDGTEWGEAATQFAAGMLFEVGIRRSQPAGEPSLDELAREIAKDWNGRITTGDDIRAALPDRDWSATLLSQVNWDEVAGALRVGRPAGASEPSLDVERMTFAIQRELHLDEAHGFPPGFTARELALTLADHYDHAPVTDK